MPPKTRCMSEKQKRKVKETRVTKTPSAKPDTKLVESRVARSREVARETASRKDNDVVMMSSDEEEAREIRQLRDELKAANARIKQLEDLLETKQSTTSHHPTIEHDNHMDAPFKVDNSAQKPQPHDSTRTKEEDKLLNKESAPLQVTNSHKKPIALTVQVQPQLPLTPQSPSSSIFPISPYPGSTSAILHEEDLKLENVRATYTKVKTKLDTLSTLR